MPFFKSFLLFPAVLMLLAASAKAEPTLKPGDAAPCLSLSTRLPNGQVIQRSTCEASQAGKKLVIEFFSLTCRVCVLKIGFFEGLAKKYEGKADFRLIDSESDVEAVKRFFQSRDLSKYELSFDPKLDALDAFTLVETPSLLVIEGGKIRFIQEGFSSEEEEEQEIRKALGL